MVITDSQHSQLWEYKMVNIFIKTIISINNIFSSKKKLMKNMNIQMFQIHDAVNNNIQTNVREKCEKRWNMRLKNTNGA